MTFGREKRWYVSAKNFIDPETGERNKADTISFTKEEWAKDHAKFLIRNAQAVHIRAEDGTLCAVLRKDGQWEMKG